MKKARKYLLSHYNSVLNKSKEFSMPGLRGIPMYYFFRFLYIRMLNEFLNIRASSIAFNFFLALIPALMFIFSLLPYIPVTGLQSEIMYTLAQFLPENVYLILEDTIADILLTPRGGILSFGFLLTLVYASNGFYSLIEAFDKDDPRSYWKKRLLSLLLTFIIPSVLLIGFTILLSGEFVIGQLFINEGIYPSLISLFQWMMFFMMVFVAVTILFYYGTPPKKRWSIFSPGNYFASLFILLSSIAFAFYVNNFNMYNKIFRSLGALIALMLYLYITSLVLVIGYEINDIIAAGRISSKKKIMEA